MGNRILPLLRILACVFLIFLQGSASAAGQEEGATAATIELAPERAWELIQQRPDLIIVDVRTARERNHQYINNSLHIPIMDVIRGKFNLPPERPILLYCAVGARSAIAAKVLKKKGFREIYNLAGGIAAWHRLELPTVGQE